MPAIIHPSRRDFLSRRCLLAGGAGCVAATAFGVETSASDGLMVMTAPVSTPGMQPSRRKASERLTNLLSLLPPDMMGGPDPNTWLFTWLDLEMHLAALGSANPHADTANNAAIMEPLVSDDPLFHVALDEEARATFGFSILDVHQILVAGAFPNQVIYYAGGLPITNLPSVWEAAGYERMPGEAGEYWTVGENGEISMNSPVGAIGGGRLNTVAVLDEEIVVFATTASMLQRVQGLAANGGESAAQDERLSTLIGAMPADAVNAIAVQGTGLEAQSITPENPGGELNQTTIDLLAESDDAVGPMPEIEMALFGITSGVVGAGIGPATPASQSVMIDRVPRFFANLLTGSADDALAAAKVVEWRIGNMISPVAGYAYSDRLVPELSGEQAVEGNVAALTFTSPETLASWYQLLMVQDLWPFVWLESG